MTVLGFDTATSATAVALRLSDGRTLRARDDPGSGERPGHTSKLLPLARELLTEAGLDWPAVELVAVGVGPGTFTGLRVGVATARGLAQALAVDVVGVSTPRVLAQAAIAARAADGVLAVIDARRGEVFAAAFTACPLGEDGKAAPCARELRPVQALAPASLAEVATAVDPDRRWLAVGDGALRFRAQLQADGIAVLEEDSQLHRVDAGVLCELALAMPREAGVEAVEPDYRRRPDAEIALQKAPS